MKPLTGDSNLSRRERWAYLFRNLLRGVAGYGCRLDSTYWCCDELDDGTGSPGRKCLGKWLSKELGNVVAPGTVAVLDIGCGSGYLRKVFAEAGFKGSYTGIDSVKHKGFETEAHPNFKSAFVQTTIENFETSDLFDIVISVTALEHIENDALAVSKSRKRLKPGGVQIHIVPTFWALFLYLWHGYRQYNPRSIRRLFNGQTYRVYRLGGLFSFFLHLFFITIPVFCFKKDGLRKMASYPKLTQTCNKLDRLLPVCSSLYLVVVEGTK
jgi:SAM-dependent methyltransferase